MTENHENIEKLETSSISSEAASWVAQIDGDSMSNADRLALREWALRSPKHIAELRRLGELWFDIDAVLQTEIEKYDVQPSVAKVAVSAVKLRPKQSYGFLAIAATVLFACSVAWVQAPMGIGVLPVQVAYNVDYGENKVFNLDDGSTIHANTDSFFEVEFTQHQRIIRLIKGEVHFDVAHDEDRPFIVYAGGSIVRAVGTAFVVHIKHDKTSVIVTEGKVELNNLRRGGSLSRNGVVFTTPKIKPTLISAGESVTIKPADVELIAEVKPISEALIDKKLAWRNGLVVFEGEALSEVVDEISRYTNTKIIISDPAIRDMPFGGVFPAGQVDALLGALQTSYGVAVERVSDDVIYLKKATAG